MTLRRGEKIFPGVDDEVALEQARITISNLIDAVVELVTNCDDSYLTIEQAGRPTRGNIDIVVHRRKGNRLDRLTVIDNAAGMISPKMEQVIRFGKKTSSIYEGKSVRGFLGRGLKESIIAIGEGEILSVAQGRRTHGRYYFDKGIGKLVWETMDADSETSEPSGTTITITPRPKSERACPTFETLEKKIRYHFALRDILLSSKRSVRLTVDTVGQRKTRSEGPKQLRYDPPRAQQIENRKLYLKGFGVAHLNLYECSERLEYTRNDPCSQAGVLIKTENAILDNQLFGFDNDPDAHYFYGDVRCPHISDAVRGGETGIIKSDRTGLNWRHKSCAELERELKTVLERHIRRKKEQARSRLREELMPRERSARFKRLFRKLNALGRELIAGSGPGSDIEAGRQQVSHLAVFPVEGSAPPGESRTYTVYNRAVTLEKDARVGVVLDDARGRFDVSARDIALKRHRKVKELVVGYFSIKGFRVGDRTGIVVRQGSEEDYAEFVVRRASDSKGKRKGKEPPKESAGGLFKEIRFDLIDRNPSQRVYYDRSAGTVTIYLHYPGISPYLGANGEGSETERGGILLSELIAEAFCRETARRKVESQFYDPEARLDQYLKTYNEHLRLCIPIIHSIWVRI